MHVCLSARQQFVALVSGMICAGPVVADPAKDTPSALPVVKTWGELRRAQVIEVGRGVTVRLGIEAADCPVAHGVFLYALTDGYAPPEEWSEEDRLGPFYVALADADGKPLDHCRWGFGLVPHQKVPSDLVKSELLFVRRVVVPKAGAVRVTIGMRMGRQGDGKVVATGQVKAAGESHPFDRFEVVGPEPKAGQTAFKVRNKGVGPALPRWPEFCPIVGRSAEDGKDRRAADEPLPRLIPAEPSPALKMSVADGVLTVRSEAGTGTSAPDHDFLARWWVNGKPVVQAVPKDPDLGVLGWQLTKDKRPEIRLTLDLALDRLGAKSGDLIGVQVLYAAYGTDAVTDRMLSILKGWDRPVLPMLSNRVEFRAK
jgi:hypothetical protein